MTDTRHALVFVGCYTAGAGGDGEGIVAARRSPDGGLTSMGLVARTPSPSFVVRHPELPVLYAVNELEGGTVPTFALPASPNGDDPPLELTTLGTWSSGGSFPCHLTVANGWLAIANYGDGAVAGLPLDEHGVPDGLIAVAVHKGHI